MLLSTNAEMLSPRIDGMQVSSGDVEPTMLEAFTRMHTFFKLNHVHQLKTGAADKPELTGEQGMLALSCLPFRKSACIAGADMWKVISCFV